ncbi:hypothetical protein GOV07_01365 [Candidatus Woesearchaeota archaeon]|nr:hypothetical protein [Candidatus Woesearchaeota archaeon]
MEGDGSLSVVTMAYINARSKIQEGLEAQWGELLIKHGFIIKEDMFGKSVRSKYKFDPVTKHYLPKDGGMYNPDDAMMEYAEDVLMSGPHQPKIADYVPTGYPSPLKRFHILYETMSLSIEEVYFWLIDHMRYDQGFMHAHKVKDVFTATENSAFFGTSQQRLGIQQDRAQQYLATIGKMVKDLFQLVRELRIIDEKLLPRTDWKESKSADATLKGEYIDLVENRGGQTSPGSVYGLSQQLGYATLPDLFFNTHVTDLDKVDETVDKLDFNTTLKNVLKRKLYQYVNWKLKTDHELESRRTFTLKYLRQHWDVIEMYMSWIKPYLRHVARLQMNDDKLDSIDLITAFEQSYVETEVLFAKPEVSGRKHFEVIIISINFRTRPNMSYVQEGYQKGPSHVGQADIYWRAYAWEQHSIDNYIRYRKAEDLYMLGVVDTSVQAAMEALGEELEKYLAEAGEPKYKDKIEKEEAEREEQLKKQKIPGPFSGLAEPFSALGSGFSEMFGFSGAGSMLSLGMKKGKEKKYGFPPTLATGGKLSGNHKAQLVQCMKNFKKAHGMFHWG